MKHMSKKSLFLTFIKSVFKSFSVSIWSQSRHDRNQIEKLINQSSKSRQHVMQAFEKSLNEYDTLYKKLAK